jgi:glucokinase
LKRLIEENVGIDTFVDNDVNLMTLGELHYGAGKDAKNMVCLTLGTGVGGGIVIDGKLYRGSTLTAGEIGHIPINEKGPKCSCGSAGCLERYVGNRHIITLALRKLSGNKKSLILALVNGNRANITPEIISKAAKVDDRLAIEIWQEVGRHIGIALTGVVNFLNPEKIIIGGGVAAAGKVLFDSIRATVNERAMDVPKRGVKIVPAKLGNNAGLIGASILTKGEKGI